MVFLIQRYGKLEQLSCRIQSDRVIYVCEIELRFFTHETGGNYERITNIEMWLNFTAEQTEIVRSTMREQSVPTMSSKFLSQGFLRIALIIKVVHVLLQFRVQFRTVCSL